MILRHVPFTLRCWWLLLTLRHHQAFWLAFAYWRRFRRVHLHPVVCAWCQWPKQFGNPALPTSHGIYRTCRAQFHVVPLAV